MGTRTADFRKGTRLGRDDHLVVWRNPTSIRPVDRRTYAAPPDSITVREGRFRVEHRGFRTRSIGVVTTILKPERASREEQLHGWRGGWQADAGQHEPPPRCRGRCGVL